MLYIGWIRGIELSRRLSRELILLYLDRYGGIELSRRLSRELILLYWGWILEYSGISRLSRDVSGYSNWHIHVRWMVEESDWGDILATRDCLESRICCYWMNIEVSSCPGDCPEDELAVSSWHIHVDGWYCMIVSLEWGVKYDVLRTLEADWVI